MCYHLQVYPSTTQCQNILQAARQNSSVHLGHLWYFVWISCTTTFLHFTSDIQVYVLFSKKNYMRVKVLCTVQEKCARHGHWNKIGAEYVGPCTG
jgi:hypothetical protein